MPTPAARAVAIIDWAYFSSYFILDAFTKTAARQFLHDTLLDARSLGSVKFPYALALFHEYIFRTHQ